MYGVSGYGTGLYGVSNGSGNGVFAYSSTGTGVYAYTGGSDDSAVYAYTPGTSTGVTTSSYSGTGLSASSTSGYGIQAFSNGGPEALTALNNSGNATDFRGTYIGIIGRAPASGGYPLVLTDSNGNDLFQVDGAGNVAFTGQLQTLSRSSAGGIVQSFSAKTTQPTVEDYGTAQLSAGSASVVLNPTFAASIDMTTPYRVFITPSGDTRGLFVPVKTTRGFIVRESQGGRSTVSFDYRIVATAQGQAGKRMSAASMANMARAPIGSSQPPAVKRPVLPPGFPAQANAIR